MKGPVSGRSAFSFMEIVIITVIVGILIAVSLPSWIRAKEVGYVREAGVSLELILQAYRQYYIDMGGYGVSYTEITSSSWMSFNPSVSSDWNYAATAPSYNSLLITATRTGGGPAYDGTTIVINQNGDLVPSGGQHPLAEYGDF